MMGDGVTERADVLIEGSYIKNRLVFLCLEYTLVLSIFLLLSVITVFMSSTVIF